MNRNVKLIIFPLVLIKRRQEQVPVNHANTPLDGSNDKIYECPQAEINKHTCVNNPSMVFYSWLTLFGITVDRKY